MTTLTPAAIAQIKVLNKENEKALRIGVRGGGCTGFMYSMQFTNEEPSMMDKLLHFDDLTVYVDGVSNTYLDGCEVDYVETLEQAGFKFNNPNVKTTCGCGQSFAA